MAINGCFLKPNKPPSFCGVIQKLQRPSGRAGAVAQVADACGEADARAAASHLADGIDEVLRHHHGWIDDGWVINVSP